MDRKQKWEQGALIARLNTAPKSWKIRKLHTMFQAELMGLKEAIIRASQENEITKIWTDSLSSAMAVLDPHTPHQLVRDIQSLLTQNRNILVRWIKAHAGYLGHGPFPSFFNRFHLSDSDSCACGEVGDPIHYATSCPLTLSWRIRKPSTSMESLWYRRVLENPTSRKRIINLIKFIIDNDNIIRLE
ncbi:hypothetical protein AVEN_195131-1 [Araneus ventricosus]|uniref:RNase H type-1 domain-containing protein n=1 Tax=Araneus ventricosus TaxID=182803 RepID=A0A4Y2BIM5_ARAVE|nr:hypothetical protein AVEN_195131-1 [Araneus ventricosus]